MTQHNGNANDKDQLADALSRMTSSPQDSEHETSVNTDPSSAGADHPPAPPHADTEPDEAAVVPSNAPPTLHRKAVRPAAPGMPLPTDLKPSRAPAPVKIQLGAVPAQPRTSDAPAAPDAPHRAPVPPAAATPIATSNVSTDRPRATRLPPAPPAPASHVKPSTSKPGRTPVYRRMTFRRTIIPILLTLGVLLPSLGLLPFVVSADSPFAAVQAPVAITFIATGGVLLLLAIVNMMQVRHALKLAGTE